MDINSKSRANSINRPFYKPPENITLSSQIISEARSSLKMLGTKRPFTPLDEQRHLFPPASNRTSEARPPSAFSVNSQHFESSESRPLSGTRLTPLVHVPKTCSTIEEKNLLPILHTPDANSCRDYRSGKCRNDVRSVQGVDGAGNQKSLLIVSLTNDDGGAAIQESSTIVPESEAKECPFTHSLVRGNIATNDALLPHISASVNNSLHRINQSREKPHDHRDKCHASGSGHNHTESVCQHDGDIDVFFATMFAPSLDHMWDLHRRKDNQGLLISVTELCSLLEESNCLGKQFRYRSTILKVLFRLLDVDDAELRLKLASMILDFKVSGNNLTNICKLVFKISRNEENDALFMEGSILNLLLDTIRTVDHVSACDALVYCVGTLKFLSGNVCVLARLASLDCVQVLADLMQNIAKTSKQNEKGVYSQFSNLLVQLTAALRNLADAGDGREKFVTHKVVQGLAELMDCYPADGDLMLYVSRILSKVTLHTDCCNILVDLWASYKAFTRLLNEHLHKADVIVRICFVLGNLTAKNEIARQRLFSELHAVDSLLLVMKTYDKLDIERGQLGCDNGKPLSTDAPNKFEDVLIKVLRVFANLSLSEDVGTSIAANLDLMASIVDILDRKEMVESMELMLNCVATINNLTYYTTRPNSGVESIQHFKVTESLLRLTLSDNMECMLEVSRVFGNLTRFLEIRRHLSQHKVDAMMVTLLDAGNREMVFVATGVLINFMMDSDNRCLLRQENGILKCLDVLRDFGSDDCELSANICKLLCNYSAEVPIMSSSPCAFFTQQEVTQLTGLLDVYLDDESFLLSACTCSNDEVMIGHLKCILETEFKPAAVQLLHQIQPLLRSPPERLAESPG